jgi:hypothetical protein
VLVTTVHFYCKRKTWLSNAAARDVRPEHRFMKLLTVHYKYVESSDQSVDYELTMHTLNDLIAPPVMTPLEICLPDVK